MFRTIQFICSQLADFHHAYQLIMHKTDLATVNLKDDNLVYQATYSKP